jgi:four helix bundle protein
MRDFRDLKVWEKARRLTLEVNRVTKTFPREEQFGLTSQLRRAAGSVPANIAEGCGRDGRVELARFCRIAMGSASELEYRLLLARDLGLLEGADHTNLDDHVTEVKRLLTAFVQKLTPDA